MGKAATRRCAIYTRKSSEEGLEQDFNSLDAQREACEAYVLSQAAEGWDRIDTRYDDGGFSGGSMERPGLAALLADIERGSIDVVVVYKIDRLTRSLADFARMVELFDRHEVSFVSVTQAFNTTNSMGRLTLNVLLSFAQFEREVTGERIRDKIAASKAKGMWMGGNLPLGYDRPAGTDRILRVNAKEADLVRLIFARYLELKSVHALRDWLGEHGHRPKRWVSSRGRTIGGDEFSRGALFHILRNPVYLGQIRHKGRIHPGGHQAIVERTVFRKVARMLEASANRHAGNRNPTCRGRLAGRLFDLHGDPMSPSFTHGRKGRVYRYYVSSSLNKGRRVTTDPDCNQRIPADALERYLEDTLGRLLPKAKDALEQPRRLELRRGSVAIILEARSAIGIQGRLRVAEMLDAIPADPDHVRLTLPLSVRNQRGRSVIMQSRDNRPKPDPAMIAALRKAHRMLDLDGYRLPVIATSPDTQYDRRILQLALLAPDIQAAIMAGTQPAHLNLEMLIDRPVPADWEEQRALLA